ncbi:hypothetical protein GUJ93_ZPchr0008g11771 [Zizania palustris]|uniref:Uncharacterized protein n=1 Tax=Zizania palustris TaxID=103762 RepID=A0A8J5RDB2_ZIZPA|nr:hypothetical protein GUJ93_ZPchr0008g11771 [Zizania palustris]
MLEAADENKENSGRDSLLDIYIKWESGHLIKGLKLLSNSCLSDMRKLLRLTLKKEAASMLRSSSPSSASGILPAPRCSERKKQVCR